VSPPGGALILYRNSPKRSLRDLIEIVARLESDGIQFVSLTEDINTKTASGKLIFHVFAVLAEFERNLIRERTMAGLATARARGRLGGAKKRTTTQQDKQIRALWESGKFTGAEIASQFGISVVALHYKLKSLVACFQQFIAF
jgi:DNA invertase Pin-like site-specific DNA recombinase